MNLYLGYDSALAYWRAHPLDPVRSRTTRACSLAQCAHSLKKIETFACEQHGIDTDPLHVLVSHPALANSSKHLICHVSTQPSPAGSFARIGENLLVGSPELVFFHGAQTGSLAHVVALGHELCGFYRVSPLSPDGFVQAAPLTSARKLQSFAAKLGSARGAVQARKAALYVADNSASPRETLCSELLCLPRAQGGYGLPLPKMNYEVEVLRSADKAQRKTLFCDLYWPKCKLAVEYESDLYHSGEKNIAHDSKRRSKLEREGVHVVTVTNDQIKSVVDFDEVAHVLAKRMGIRLRIRREDFRTRQLKLRTELMRSRP